MTDRLRDLLDLVVGSLDDAGLDGPALARRAAFSRDHLDRVLASATGETPVALRRRLLLERAAWQLRAEPDVPVSTIARAAGYTSAAAFSRAFARAYGTPPSAFATSGAPVAIPAPNGIHFHAPAGLHLAGPARDPGPATPAPRRRDVLDRLIGHHLDRTRDLLDRAERLTPGDLDREMRPGLVIVDFEGAEPTARQMANRLVVTLEVWVAAMAGEPQPPTEQDDLIRRFDHAAAAFSRIVARLRDRDAWDDAFIDALCEPPQAFTYGGVVAHVIAYGAVRRETLAAVLTELGAPPRTSADPISWESERQDRSASTLASTGRTAAGRRGPRATRPG
ncbi:helix-turn-helix domain-containing protein [Paraconexibacter sp.]|uniref:helix-turn-helix domain-containing protein n=1 Tax=Paraconexibacter sp. TaxID=2949640 RepID=UPI00356647B2